MDDIYKYVKDLKDLSIEEIIKKIYYDFDDFDNRYRQMRFILYEKYNIKLPKDVNLYEDLTKDRNKYLQNKFRENLLKRFTKCLVCDVNNAKLLKACHIKPYADTKSYDIDNGLIMCGLHHDMYDLKMFSINKKYDIIMLEECDYIQVSNVKDILEKYNGIAKYLFV